MKRIIGTSLSDYLFGTSGDDFIDAGDGNDTIEAGYGFDIVFAGAGDDNVRIDNGRNNKGTESLIFGEDGNDTLYSNSSEATIYGGNGDDNISGGQFTTLLAYGDTGNDTIFASNRQATIYGGSGDDRVSALGGGGKTIYGDDGNDWLSASSGANDYIDGGKGDDFLTGGPSAASYLPIDADTILGGDGDDGLYVGSVFNKTSIYDGGEGGNDQVGLQGDFRINLGDFQLDNVEVVALLSGTDTRFGYTGSDSFSYDITTVDSDVAAGKTMTFYATHLQADEHFSLHAESEINGNFIVFTGHGNDTITTGAGDDQIYFGWGKDVLNSGAGNDKFIFLQESSGSRSVINNFEVGTDKIDMSLYDSDFGMSDGESLIANATTENGSTILNINDSTQIVLVGVDVSQLLATALFV